MSASERNNLVGIGHSGGGGSLMQGLDYGVRGGHRIPLKSLTLVEVPLIGPEVWPSFQVLYDRVKKSNARRPTSWPSKEAAMKWFTTHLPWKHFSPAVLRIVEDTYFIPDSKRPGFITTKTTVEQETSCFVDNGTQLLSFSFLRTVLAILPTHIIVGVDRDLWFAQLSGIFLLSHRCFRPASVYDVNDENTRQVRPQLASETGINDAGHYLPTVKPRDVAAVVFQILSRNPSKLSKL